MSRPSALCRPVFRQARLLSALWRILRLCPFPYAFSTTLQRFLSSWQKFWLVRCYLSNVLTYYYVEGTFLKVQRTRKKTQVDSFLRRWVRYCMLSAQIRLSEFRRRHFLFRLPRTLPIASIFTTEVVSWDMVSQQCSSIELSKALSVDVFTQTFAHAFIFRTESCEMQDAFSLVFFLRLQSRALSLCFLIPLANAFIFTTKDVTWKAASLQCSVLKIGSWPFPYASIHNVKQAFIIKTDDAIWKTLCIPCSYWELRLFQFP